MKKIIRVAVAKVKVPLLDYIVIDDMFSLEFAIGDVVLVPFRNDEVLGIVVDILNDSPYLAKLKEVIGYEGYRLSERLMKFILWMCDYYMIDIGSIVKAILSVQMKSPEEGRRSKIKSLNMNNIILSSKLPTLNEAQENALEIIRNTQDKPILLRGITGSGKTAVYIRRIYDELMRGRQVLVLLPEIGLVQHVVEHFRRIFDVEPFIWHSHISKGKKSRILYEVLQENPCIVCGTRSSLFLPFFNLGLIIVDEEHDSSYKQEEMFLYNARDAAVMRSKIERKCDIILSSATPSIETYNNVVNGKYAIAEIDSRYGEASLPSVKIVDMHENDKLQKAMHRPRGENRLYWISIALYREIARAIERKEQTLLFLNRRGYAPLMLCSDCSYRFACENCSIWMVFHKSKNALICHHCNYTTALPESCPICLSQNFAACGPGVERVAEEIEKSFPSARIMTVTRDDFSNDEKIQEVIKTISNHEVDIIIGTQIITKGYHFPNITTVGILDADIGIGSSEFRALENTYQLLYQVAGRSGREDKAGTVLIQTYFATNPVMLAICNLHNDEKSHAYTFYDLELERRKSSNLPPYKRIAVIIISDSDQYVAQKSAQDITKILTQMSKKVAHNISVLGPAPTTINRIKRQFQFRILIVCDKQFAIQNLLQHVLNYAQSTVKSHTKIKIEIDPYTIH